jgi:AraC-like DNA-binding protein
MKPLLVPLVLLPDESFTVNVIQTAGGSTLFNYHTGGQITLIVAGQGRRFVGDSIEPYAAGDLVLLGSYLPHMWREEEAGGEHESLVVNFAEDVLGPDFIARPEAQAIRELLHAAQRGLRVTGRTLPRATRLMEKLRATSGWPRLLTLLELLGTLATSRDLTPLASLHYLPPLEGHVGDRLARVLAYIHEHSHRPLNRARLARVAGLSESAFSRYFMLRTDRSVPEFLNEVRVGRACRLLVETNRPIADLATACGYANLANFNRRFLELKQTTPSLFREQFRRVSALA